MVQIAILSASFVKKYASSFCKVIPHNRVLLEHFLYHFQPLALEVLGASKQAFFGHEAPTASDEVARGRLVSLEGFPFAFRAKNGEWHVSQLGFQVLLRALDFNDGMCMYSTPRVCVCVCMYVCMYGCVYVCMCACVCVSPSSME